MCCDYSSPKLLNQVQDSFCAADPPQGPFVILMKAVTLKLLSRQGSHVISIIFGSEKDQETIFQGQTIQFDLWCF